MIEDLLTLLVVYGSGKREINVESAVKFITVSYSCKVDKSAICITLCVIIRFDKIKFVKMITGRVYILFFATYKI